MVGQEVFNLVSTYCLPLLLVLLIFSLARNKLKSGLQDIPGPTLAAYTKFWRVYDVSKGQAHWTTIALHKKYGKLVRIAPNVVSISDPAAIPVIYSTKGDFTKTDFYSLQAIIWHQNPLMNIFSTQDEAENRTIKRRVANAYTQESLLKMEHAIDDCSRLLMSLIGERTDRGESVDLGAWMGYYGKTPVMLRLACIC